MLHVRGGVFLFGKKESDVDDDDQVEFQPRIICSDRGGEAFEIWL